MPSPNSPCPIYTAAGAVVPYTGTGTIADPWLNVLTLGTTYYAELGSEFYSTGAAQWVHDAAIILTGITYEISAVPRVGLATWGAAAGGWKAESLITTITAAGGTAACPISKITGVGTDRVRGVIVVGATGGSCVPFQNWKVS